MIGDTRSEISRISVMENPLLSDGALRMRIDSYLQRSLARTPSYLKDGLMLNLA